MAKSKYRDHEKPLNDREIVEGVDQFPPNVVVPVPNGAVDLQLEPPSERSAEDVNKELTDTKLPLSDQDRAAIENANERRRGRQFSIFEMMALCTIVCTVIAASKWFSLGACPVTQLALENKMKMR